MNEDRRLIEDYLPIKAISKEASREKSIRKGHISTLHLWWARRPLVACRAAVYGALVPADQFRPKNGPPEKRNSLGRANAAKFLERLCKYPGNPQVIKEAQRHILEAHAERLTRETGEKVTLEDIEQGRAPRPKVLDMFAGGGSIPLEALRLGCEAYALELNPVAHIIELCTLVYPQKYGKADLNAGGMTGPKNKKSEKTWGGLAEEVRYWGEGVLERVREEIGDLYPPIPDPEYKGERPEIEFTKGHWVEKGESSNALEEWAGVNNGPPHGYLNPVAYLWTRTVPCKNPLCGFTVPLVKQTWLCKQKGRYVALKVIALKGEKQAHFKVVEVNNERDLGFDPSTGSKGGNTTCPICGTLADSIYAREQGQAKRIGKQLMCIIGKRGNRNEKEYLGSDYINIYFNSKIPERLANIEVNFESLNEKIVGLSSNLPNYGFNNFKEIFNDRQLLALLTFAKIKMQCYEEMNRKHINKENSSAVITYLALVLDKLTLRHNTMCTWAVTSPGGRLTQAFGRQTLSMIWDYAEANPFSGASGDYLLALSDTAIHADILKDIGRPADVKRGSAQNLPYDTATYDIILTDPPYYDNIMYADISDFFYVWLRIILKEILPEHFSSKLTPKKKEIVSAVNRHNNKKEAKLFYERQMANSFIEANRVLKPGGYLVCVYAHKTTVGWATLVNAIKNSGFTVLEAWPVSTELVGHLKANIAALASSIFIVAIKGERIAEGSYEELVQPELTDIVKEQVETLWEMGVTGADLVIAAVGAGLRAFTRYTRVEFANGEEVPAEHFLSEVETVVLETILQRLSREVGGDGGQFSLAGVDTATRFYILWRYTYKYSILDAGEAIIFANGTHVELDGPNGLTTGVRALLEKKKGKYMLKDYTDRGSDEKLGQMMEDGQSALMIDALHRTLWLMENRPAELTTFLQEAQPNSEQMRLVAQALAGPALKGGELGDISPHAELSALAKLTANWKSVIEGAALTPLEKKERKTGQRSLFK